MGGPGQLGYDALAATLPHPAYPTAESRLGFSDDDALRYAPEYAAGVRAALGGGAARRA